MIHHDTVGIRLKPLTNLFSAGMNGTPSVHSHEDWLKTIEELGCSFVEASPEIEREKELMGKCIPEFVGLVCEHRDFFMQMSEDGTYDNLALLFHRIEVRVSNADNKRAKLQILLDCLDEALAESKGIPIPIFMGDETDDEYTNTDLGDDGLAGTLSSAEETDDLPGF